MLVTYNTQYLLMLFSRKGGHGAYFRQEVKLDWHFSTTQLYDLGAVMVLGPDSN